MPTPSAKLGLALPSQPDDFSTADLRANWEKIDAAPGAYICTSTTRPTWGANQAGREIIETNTGVRRMWTGTVWQATSPEPGDTKWSFRAETPDGWLPCDGRLLNRSTYSHLFAAIGTTHNTGGEDSTNFRIPNAIGRTMIGRNPTNGASYNLLGDPKGSTTATLQATNLPPHSHTITHAHPAGTTDNENADHNHTGWTTGGAHEHGEVRNSENAFKAVAEGTGVVKAYMVGAQAVNTTGGGGHNHDVTTHGASAHHQHTFTTPTFTGSSGNGPGASTPFSIMQPTLTANCFIKI